MDLVKGVKNDLTAAVLCGGNLALVLKPGGSESGELPLLSRFSGFFHVRVVFVEWVFILDKQ